MLEDKIAIIGLGYVGLPLSLEFGRHYKTIGFDINNSRITELSNYNDISCGISSLEILSSRYLEFSSNIEDIKNCNVYIIAVPTAIDKNKNPNLTAIKTASEMIGSILKKDDIIIYESTVYPGLTEEICIPILENNSKLALNEGFFCGYSPERINPGDTNHQIQSITKIVSASNAATLEKLVHLYETIIPAGIHQASSIRVAEAAKVIENTQRDVNIALINEFAMILKKLNLETDEVLAAAATKWNFLPFKPGIVGGHCIGVDPYYLTHKAKAIGFNPKMILSGREVNDGMGDYIALEVMQIMRDNDIAINNSKVLIMGFTYKENTSDIRNSKVADIYTNLSNNGCDVEIYDPYANPELTLETYQISLIGSPKRMYYDAIILAVGHAQFMETSIKKLREFGKEKHVFYDIKSIFSRDEVDGRL